MTKALKPGKRQEVEAVVTVLFGDSRESTRLGPDRVHLVHRSHRTPLEWGSGILLTSPGRQARMSCSAQGVNELRDVR
jgi:hypothetical protein